MKNKENMLQKKKENKNIYKKKRKKKGMYTIRLNKINK